MKRIIIYLKLFLLLSSTFVFSQYATELKELYNKTTLIIDEGKVEFDDTIGQRTIIDETHFGWNLGNTLDAYEDKKQNEGLNSERLWGQPYTTDDEDEYRYEKYKEDLPRVGSSILVYLIAIGISAIGMFVDCVSRNTIIALIFSILVTFFDSLAIVYCSNEMYDPIEATLWMLMIIAFFLFISSLFYNEETKKPTLYIVTVLFGIGGIFFACNMKKHSYDYGWSVAFCIFGFITSVVMHIWMELDKNEDCVFSPIFRLTISGPCVVIAIAGSCCGV